MWVLEAVCIVLAVLLLSSSAVMAWHYWLERRENDDA